MPLWTVVLCLYARNEIATIVFHVAADDVAIAIERVNGSAFYPHDILHAVVAAFPDQVTSVYPPNPKHVKL